MSTATASTLSKAKAEKEREKKLSQSQEDERLKAVVRRLPPNLPEDVFWQSVQSWVTEETTTWKAYSPGKFRKKCDFIEL
jgi:regulator of nonsense transcripts 3